METVEHRIAYFISPHGYGHAARAAAVMKAVVTLNPAIRFEIFTRVPRWFFEDSLTDHFGYHSLLTDIGLVQRTSLLEDLPETVKRLDGFLPFADSLIKDLARQVSQLRCRLVICDIAPMGIAVASEAGIPSVLVENFTWDWIYQGYVEQDRRMERHISYLQKWFDDADYHIQTEPICQHRDADLTTSPVSREIRTSTRQIRHQLGIANGAQVVMVTMGGIPWHYAFLEQLATQKNLTFLIPGGSEEMQVRDNMVLLPNQSAFFHPDLVNASDVVIGKLGYSTVAEVYQAGVSFGYIPRPGFRESQFLAAFVERNQGGFAISDRAFQTGQWLSHVPDLLALPRMKRGGPNGATQVAEFLGKLLDSLD